MRELAILRVGQLLQADCEFAQHVPLALQAGVERGQIDRLANWASSGEFNIEEQAVLRYTEELTRDIRVGDDTFAELRKLFNEHCIVELTVAVGYYNMICRVLVGLQIELET